TRRPSPVTGEKRIDLPKKPFYPAPLLINDTNVAKWPSTPGFQAFWGWLSQRCRRIRGKPMRNEEYQGSCSAIGSLLDILDHMEDWVSEIPPLPQNNMRFGNLAFRQYNQRMERELAHHIVRCHGIPFELPPQIIPLLVDSHAFGHPTRLDYGTGHELAFVLVLWNCVASKWIKDEDDQDDLILRVFPRRYMHLVNLLQRKYRLEPAGSHGVWGLDDYCFFPYLFGAAQLMGTSITPAQSLENAQSIVSDPSTTGPFDMYTYALVHVIQSKTGAPFSEHSPTLYAVSRLPNWEKAFQGLRKFFLNEVAGKRVVVQGLLMGGWCWGEEFPDTTREGHVNLLEEGGLGSTRAPWMRGR
ncbi:hypothetical protein TREMEDRAFT_24529, partial [Tremella mesenterica DSM 1558]|uniref:uncharacterized protein n=1 Tax=Tremella mesenterica (strain ATCC 24925 / CBS 8224 / DSM 1558 / NBRC 9311 / NRRL Y-6157 / RJB 2259-6 / UBC 559-6) TaxID=578456 RepID=UPI0003F4A0A5